MNARRRALQSFAAVIAGCWVLAAPAAAMAQSIRGMVVDADSGAGIPEVTIEVLREASPIGRAVSDAEGSFTIYLEDGGAVLLRASRVGLAPVEWGAIEIGDREQVVVLIPMSNTAIVLDDIEVAVRRRDPRVDATFEGFLARRERTPPVGSSRVVTRTDQAMLAATTVRDVLRSFLPPRGCVDYYVDGRAVQSEHWAEFLMDLPTEMLEGLEFYREDWSRPNGFDVPMRPFLLSGATCSVIAIWWRRAG